MDAKMILILQQNKSGSQQKKITNKNKEHEEKFKQKTEVMPSKHKNKEQKGKHNYFQNT